MEVYTTPLRFLDIFEIVELWYGEVAEWLKAHAWKACGRESVSRVRISPSPPVYVVKRWNQTKLP